MITFALIGGIACGKSTASKTFIANHIPMVDADIVARQVVEPGTDGLFQIINCFGKEFLQIDGTLDRKKFGNYIFANKEALAKLNEIMAPLITLEGHSQINTLHQAGHDIVGWEAFTIAEENNKFHPLIVVTCPQDIQIKRLMSRNSLTYQQAMDRINSQKSLEEKIKSADYIIDTSKDIEYSVQQTIKIIEDLKNGKF